jgi:hypothetical protein
MVLILNNIKINESEYFADLSKKIIRKNLSNLLKFYNNSWRMHKYVVITSKIHRILKKKKSESFLNLNYIYLLINTKKIIY